MQYRGAFDNPSPILFFISSRQWADADAERVRVPTWHHVVVDHAFLIPLLHVLFASVPSVTLGAKGGGESWARLRSPNGLITVHAGFDFGLDYYFR